jgi:hypothetical protein
MRLFRSEEHVRRAYRSPGAIVPLEQLWRVAKAWYGDRLSPDWVPPSKRSSQRRLRTAGLTGRFWRL